MLAYRIVQELAKRWRDIDLLLKYLVYRIIQIARVDLDFRTFGLDLSGVVDGVHRLQGLDDLRQAHAVLGKFL